MRKEMKILIIEDNPGDAELVKEMLDQATGRYSFETETRLSDGLKRVDQGGIDLVVLDLGLPDSKGLSTLFRFRLKCGDVPVIVLTGNADEVAALEAVHNGAQDYLVKGTVDHLTLVKSIQYALERQEFLNAQGKKLRREVKILRGLLPICAGCKSIRDDAGYWKVLEEYMTEHSEALFSHGLCPACVKRLYPDLPSVGGGGHTCGSETD